MLMILYSRNLNTKLVRVVISSHSQQKVRFIFMLQLLSQLSTYPGLAGLSALGLPSMQTIYKPTLP